MSKTSTLAALLCLTSIASAQDLNIGSKAPPLSVEEWIKGSKVEAFQPGKTYVVEFWATWCGPCKASIPHLTETQKKYQARNVSIIGIAGSEHAPKDITDPAKQQEAMHTTLAKFVEEKGDEMAYTVAYDTDRSMSKAWMEPAAQGGIPTAFIVDGTGTIAWIGHPMKMDGPLEDIVAGKWDMKSAAAKAKAERDASNKANAVYTKISDLQKAEKWSDAVAAIDQAIAADATLAERLSGQKFQLMLKAGDYDNAYAFGTKLCDGVYAKNAGALNQMAWYVVDPDTKPAVAKKDFKFAVMCAQRAVDASKDDPAILDTLGLALFESGDVARAITTQERAVELAKGNEMLEKDLKARLDQFKKSRQP